jgi:lysozyme family protein
MSFETAYKQTAKFEAGYANDPRDPGGETFRGISRVSHPNWDGWPIVDQIKRELDERYGFISWTRMSSWKKVDVAAAKRPALTRLVSDYYEREFYRPILAWGLAERVTDKLFDINVNISPKNSNKILQRAINAISKTQVAVDGALGPVTLAAAKALNADALTRALARAQERFYLENTIPKFPNAKQSFLNRARWIP